MQRLLDLGAEEADIGQGAGPIAALPLHSADPDRDAAFSAEIIGWVPWVATPGTTTLRHPAGVGPLLELGPEPESSRGRNRLNLDVRPDGRDHDVVGRVLKWRATPLTDPSDHPWLVFADLSGNEFCVPAQQPR